eukprot:gene33996-43924_t
MISLWTSTTLLSASSQDAEYFGRNYNELGIGSAKAQQLNTPISTLDKLRESPSHVVLLFSTPIESSSRPVGLIRYGLKDLYFYTKEGKVIESKQTNCVLDFYVVETAQRQGVGLKLFKKMLEVTGLGPVQFAYDRPSPKLAAFMAKNFNLLDMDLQPNRYAIFGGFLP